MYFNCLNQDQCFKKVYIKYDPNKDGNVELFLAKIGHNHQQKNIPTETKEEILKLFKNNIFSFRILVDTLKKKNLNIISAKQFYNFKQRFKKSS